MPRRTPLTLGSSARKQFGWPGARAGPSRKLLGSLGSPTGSCRATAVIWNMLLLAERRFRRVNTPAPPREVLRGSAVRGRSRGPQEVAAWWQFTLLLTEPPRNTSRVLSPRYWRNSSNSAVLNSGATGGVQIPPFELVFA